MLRWIVRLSVLLALLAVALRIGFGGGGALEDRSTPPMLSFDAVQTVVELQYPPGNIAVSDSGRVFFTLHPDGKPPNKVMELVGGRPVPYPDAVYQQRSTAVPYFQSILSLRIDRQNRLWILDFADFGRGQPRLLAFDLATNRLVHRHDFPRRVAGLGSMLNDLQIDPSGRWVFIAETSPLVQTPALIVYDSEQRRSRRLLDGHVSVASEDLLIHAPQRTMRVLGLIALRIAVDSIALDRRGQWLYYGAVTGSRLYRARAEDLVDESLTAAALAERVEVFAEKSLSDGLTTDDDGGVYLTDMEHSAIHRLDSEGTLRTLLRDPRLRWPDGLSFGPDGWLYVTCSALQHVLFRPHSAVAKHAPYHIYRFRPGPRAAAGH